MARSIVKVEAQRVNHLFLCGKNIKSPSKIRAARLKK
jgi:hypothetical protein